MEPQRGTKYFVNEVYNSLFLNVVMVSFVSTELTHSSELSQQIFANSDVGCYCFYQINPENSSTLQKSRHYNVTLIL